MGFTVTFSGGIPAWLGILLAAIAIAVTAFAYLAARKTSPRGHIMFLTGLRIFAVFILTLLALKPLVTYKIQRSEEGRMLFLVDTSGSMGIRDYPNMPDRLEGVKAALSGESPQMKSLKRKFEISAYSFDKGLKGQVPLANVSLLQSQGKATEIAAALNDAAARLAGKKSRIIVFSDGVETSDRPPRYTGPVPVTAVGAGTKLSAEGTFKDIILTTVEVLPAGQPVVSKDAVAEIAAYVEGLGYAGVVAPVLLKDAAGKVLSQENVTIDAARGDQKVVLSYTPHEKGNFKLTVEIPPQQEETVKENNSRNLNVTVTDPEIKVLYVEGTLRWEYKYLKRVLERDQNVRLLALVRLSQRTFYQQGNVTDMQHTGFPGNLETLRKFNVIMIGDLPSSAFSAQDMANIKEAVSGGAGLLMLGGYDSFADGGWGATPVADVLPVDISQGAGGQDRNEFVPQLTDQGEVSPIFAGITDYFKGPGREAVRELPALLGQVRLGRAKPGAAVLASNPLRSDGFGALSVLVTQNFGSGRSVAFAGDTTWRWYAPMKGLDLESPYVRFWGQLVRWLAKREAEEAPGKPGVTVYVDKAFYALGDKVAITAEVRGPDGLMTDKAAVDARLDGPGAANVALGYAPGSKGTYSGSFEPSAAGTYKLSVAAAQGGAGLGESLASFEVGVEDVELRRIDLDEDYLRTIAAASGGAYVPLVEFPSYAASLRTEGETQNTVEVLNLRQRRVLYPLFLVFVALVAAEWLWRKRLEMP